MEKSYLKIRVFVTRWPTQAMTPIEFDTYVDVGHGRTFPAVRPSVSIQRFRHPKMMFDHRGCAKFQASFSDA